jgi:hypothetical protein
MGSFADRRKQAEAAGLLSSGDSFKIKEGDNKFRLLSECLPHAGEYKGERNFKWLCYVLDRADGKAKTFFMPHVIYKQIEALQVNEDYAFEDVPMPYDLTIHAINAGTIEVKYSLVPARKNTPITAVEAQKIAELKPLEERQKALRVKQQEQKQDQKPPDEPTHDNSEPLTDDSIPF